MAAVDAVDAVDDVDEAGGAGGGDGGGGIFGAGPAGADAPAPTSRAHVTINAVKFFIIRLSDQRVAGIDYSWKIG